MMLSKCVDCGRDVSDLAPACPGCGRPLGAKTIAALAGSDGGPKPSPGIAAVLSLVIPGAGQMYGGKVGNGLLWLFSVAVFYVVFWPIGLALHVFCVFNAARG